MKNTRQRILDAGRKLFNERGFSQVTVRMIASELGMSSGNLNYHFRKREDILEALYFEMVEVFDRRVEKLGEQEISLQLMRNDVEESLRRMLDYRFCWSDLYFILKANEKIHAHFLQAKEARLKGYRYLYTFFIQQKILEKPSFAEEYNYLRERMLDYSNTCIYASELYAREKDEARFIKRASFQLISMLYPYFTVAGKKEFRELYPSFFA